MPKLVKQSSLPCTVIVIWSLIWHHLLLQSTYEMQYFKPDQVEDFIKGLTICFMIKLGVPPQRITNTNANTNTKNVFGISGTFTENGISTVNRISITFFNAMLDWIQNMTFGVVQVDWIWYWIEILILDHIHSITQVLQYASNNMEQT